MMDSRVPSRIPVISSYGVGYKVGKVYLQALMGKAASICKYLAAGMVKLS